MKGLHSIWSITYKQYSNIAYKQYSNIVYKQYSMVLCILNIVMEAKSQKHLLKGYKMTLDIIYS